MPWSNHNLMHTPHTPHPQNGYRLDCLDRHMLIVKLVSSALKNRCTCLYLLFSFFHVLIQTIPNIKIKSSSQTPDLRPRRSWWPSPLWRPNPPGSARWEEVLWSSPLPWGTLLTIQKPGFSTQKPSFLEVKRVKTLVFP